MKTKAILITGVGLILAWLLRWQVIIPTCNEQNPGASSSYKCPYFYRADRWTGKVYAFGAYYEYPTAFMDGPFGTFSSTDLPKSTGTFEREQRLDALLQHESIPGIQQQIIKVVFESPLTLDGAHLKLFLDSISITAEGKNKLWEIYYTPSNPN